MVEFGNSRPPIPLRYALLLYPQFEVLDAFGPIEALNTLPRLRTFPHASTLDFAIVAIVAATLDPVTSGPIQADPKPFNPKIAQSVLPTHTFENAPEVDVLIVPGGFGAGPMTNSGFRPDVQGVIGYIARVFPKLQYLITVCTGSGLAAQAGVLDGQAATTNKVAWKSMTPLGRKTHWIGHARWVVTDDGKIWTSSGVSAGTDCFLAFLEKVYGSDDSGVSFANQVSAAMEYTRVKEWKDDPWAVVNNVHDVPPVE